MAGESRIEITISANASSAKGAVVDLRREVDALGGGAGDAGRAMGSFGSSLGSVKSLLAGLGVATVAMEVKDLGVAVFETGRQMESLGLSFKAITGSAAGAQAELASIKQIARDYGQDFMSMAQASKTFLAASKDTELAGSGAREVIKGVSSAVAALGLSSQDAQGVFLALGQMMSKGTVQSEELRGQLGERLPGAFGLAAKSMGVTTAELGKMLEQGQVLATDLVPKMAKAMEQEFGQAAKEAGNTGSAAMNQLTTSWTEFLTALGDAGGYEFAKKMLRELASLATQTAQSIRVATGTLTGDAKISWLNQRINQLESPEAMLSSPLAVDDSLINSGAIQKELAKLKRERSLALSDQLESQRSESSRGQAALAERESAKAHSLVKASQQETMESWTKSADQGTAAWAKFEIARSKSWKEVYSGKIDHGAFEQVMSIHQGALKKAQDDAAKKGASSATAGAKADIRGSGVLQRVEDEISAIEESLGGNRLGASIAKIEREHNKALTQIRADLVGAKGGVDELHAAEERLGDLRALKVKQAQLKAYYQEVDFWASNMTKLGELKGDPGMVYAGQLTKLQADLGREIEAVTGTAASKAQDAWNAAMTASQQSGADTTAIWQGVAQDWARIDEERIKGTQLLEERAQLERKDLYYKSLGEAATLDDGYWAHKREKLDAQLAYVQQNSSNEHAYAVYAAQQKDKLNREYLESRVNSEESFGDYLKGRLALDYGLYKSELGRRQELYAQFYESTKRGLDAIESAIGATVGQGLSDILVGQFKSIGHYWTNLLDNMRLAFGAFAADMAKIGLREFAFKPMAEQLFGEGSYSPSGATAGASASKSAAPWSDEKQIKAFSESVGKSVKDGMDKWGYEVFGVGTSPTVAWTAANPARAAQMGMSKDDVMLAARQKQAGSQGLGSRLGSAFSAGVTGAVTGATAGSVFRPDDNLSSLVGAGAGLLGGGLAALSSIAAISSMAGPIGMAVGVIASALTGLLTPSTTKTEKIGSGLSVTVNGGVNTYAGYDAFRKTTTGFMGSSSTSHYTTRTQADPDLVRPFAQGMEDYDKTLRRSSRSLGLSTASFKEFSFPVELQFPPEYTDKVVRNLNNLKVEQQLDSQGVKPEYEQYLKEGEAFVDEVQRLATALREGRESVEQYGFSIATLSGGLSDLGQADYVSRVADAVGGYSELSSALQMLAAHTKNSSDVVSRQVGILDNRFGRAATVIGDASVTQENFWDRFDAAMQGAMDPEKVADWAEAAKALNTLEEAKKALESLAQQTRLAFSDLDVRALVAGGRDEEAQAMQRQIQFERELIEARNAGMSQDYLSRLREVQVLEEARAVQLKEQARLTQVSDYQSTLADTWGTYEEKLAALRESQAKEEFEVVWKYGYEASDLLRQIHQREMADFIQAENTRKNSYQDNLRLQMQISRLTLDGKEAEAEALQRVAGYAKALNEAVASGVSQTDMGQLMTLQRDELTHYWDSAISQLRTTVDELLAANMRAASGQVDTLALAAERMDALILRYRAGERDLQDQILSLARDSVQALKGVRDELRGAIRDLRGGDLSPLGLGERMAEQAASWAAIYNKGMSGDETALSEAPQAARQYLEAVKAATPDQDAYSSIHADVLASLARLADMSDQLATHFGDVNTQVGQDALADAQRRLREAEVAQAQSKYTLLMQQAASTMSATFEGQIISGLSNTGAGWQAGGDLLNPGYAYTGGLRVMDYLRQNPDKVSGYLGWFRENYGTGTGELPWDQVLTQWQSLGALPSQVAQIMAEAAQAKAALDAIKSSYGFANGGIMTGSGPVPLHAYSLGGIADSPQLALFGEGSMSEAYVPLPDGRSIPVSLRVSGSGGGEIAVLARLVERLISVVVTSDDGRKRADEQTVATLKRVAGMLDLCGASDGTIKVEVSQP